MVSRVSVPRQSDDYTRDAAQARREFLKEQAGASLELRAPHSVHKMIRLCARPSSACSRMVPQWPQR